MEVKTSIDFHPEVLRWFDKYVHGEVDRRGFLNEAAAKLAWQRTIAFFNNHLGRS